MPNKAGQTPWRFYHLQAVNLVGTVRIQPAPEQLSQSAAFPARHHILDTEIEKFVEVWIEGLKKNSALCLK